MSNPRHRRSYVRRTFEKMEEKIIVAVCGHTELYDTSSYFYRDRTKKDNAWKKVGEEVQLPVEVCRRKWKSLRDTYLRERKKEGEKRSGSAAGQVKKWKYSAVLSFLDPFIAPRETSGNMARGVEEDGAAEESMVVEGEERDDEAAAAGPSSVEIEHGDQSSDEQSGSAPPPATPDSAADGPSAAARGPAAGPSGEGGSATAGWRCRKGARERNNRRMRIEELLINSLERQQTAPPAPAPPPCTVPQQPASFPEEVVTPKKRIRKISNPQNDL
ncbi:uncharacterized protein [Trachinotus anak]|uniref:uncharacterized protein n=1 Tax=Trachinotus anak TaxID=443729 RepID=UPI0039F20E0C